MLSIDTAETADAAEMHACDEVVMVMVAPGSLDGGDDLVGGGVGGVAADEGLGVHEHSQVRSEFDGVRVGDFGDPALRPRQNHSPDGASAAMVLAAFGHCPTSVNARH